MLALGPIAFTAPAVLVALLALPVLWFLLRAVPPAPLRRRFPGVALLIGLNDDESQTDKTPWWLLLLRMAAAALVILGFAGPILNPQSESTGTGPLLVLVDGTWADARDWNRRATRLDAVLDEASRDGRPVALALTTDLPPEGPQFQAAERWKSRLPGILPNPWAPEAARLTEWADALEGRFQTYWMSDGIARDGRMQVLGALESHGDVRIFESPAPAYALRPVVLQDGDILLTALRAGAGATESVSITAHGLDPNGVERVLARTSAAFSLTGKTAETKLTLPPELRNRISRFTIEGYRSAAAVSLSDDSLKRREVALIAGRDEGESVAVLAPLHYLEQALSPTTDLIDGALEDLMLANPDVLIMADVAQVSELEEDALIDWVMDGGLLLRFAGPRMAASSVSRNAEHPLMPVRLRAGGRSVGGAMSWGAPKVLAPFPEGSPFIGLPIPEDVEINAQVLAQPGPDLAERTVAALADGTPLVTRKKLGAGQVVLFHVTANAEWSNLPLSVLFVQMLERLAVSTRPDLPDASDLAGTTWVPEQVLDAFGTVQTAQDRPGIAGEELADAPLSQQVPPGLYRGEDRRIALNVTNTNTVLSATNWPARVPIDGLQVAREVRLKGWVLSLAMILLALDVLATLWLSGKLMRGAVAVLALAALPLTPQDALAQETEQDLAALAATTEVVLAHVITGNEQVDALAMAGLWGLSDKLYQRTTVEPAAPISVNIETDELSFYPFLYWPITPETPLPSAQAYAKLNRYMRSGGLILFDTRDGDIARFGSGTPAGRRLQELARPLDVPPLEPVPEDHVLTRTFYLLQAFPGRYDGGSIWVEAAPADAEQAEGIPFRNLNDGVTPVVIGGNDWAGAWAINRQGLPSLPVGRGYAGERQREIAYRFGINLIMHVLTGNYKSDQVHVPDLLERLGQ